MHIKTKKTYKISKQLDQLLKQCEKHTNVADKGNENDIMSPFSLEPPIIQQQYLVSFNSVKQFLENGNVKKKGSLNKSKQKKQAKIHTNKSFFNLQTTQIQKRKNHLKTSLSIKARSIRSLSKLQNNKKQNSSIDHNNKKTKITSIKPKNMKNQIKNNNENNTQQKIQGWAFIQSPIKLCKQNVDIFGSPKQSTVFSPQFPKQKNKQLQFNLESNEPISKSKSRQKHTFLKNLKLKHIKTNKIRKKSQLRKSTQIQFIGGGDGVTIFIEDNSIEESKKQQQFNDACMKTQKYQQNSLKRFISSRESSPTKNVIINIKNIVCLEKQMQNLSFRVNHNEFIPRTQSRVMSARTSARKQRSHKTYQNQQLKQSFEQTRFISIESQLSQQDSKTQKMKQKIKTRQNFHTTNKNKQPTLVAYVKTSTNDNFTIHHHKVSPIRIEQANKSARKSDSSHSNYQTPKSKVSIRNYQFPTHYSQKNGKKSKILGWQLRMTQRGGQEFNKLKNLLRKQEQGTIHLPCEQQIAAQNSTKKLIKNKL